MVVAVMSCRGHGRNLQFITLITLPLRGMVTNKDWGQPFWEVKLVFNISMLSPVSGQQNGRPQCLLGMVHLLNLRGQTC